MLFEIDEGGDCQALGASDTPEGAYTTLRTYGAERILRLERHHARLVESSMWRGRPGSRPGSLSERRLRRGLACSLASCGLRESRVRVTFAPPRLLVQVEPFEPLPPALYESGVACACVSVRRPNPQAKDSAFLEIATQARAALAPGVHEGLMVDRSDGALLEGLSSNFFAMLGAELRTEPRRVLGGVTRALVLELAARLVTVRLEPVRQAELGQLSEAFVTSVSRGVLPVTSIDGRPVGSGAPGPVTRALSRALDECAEREALPPLG